VVYKYVLYKYSRVSWRILTHFVPVEAGTDTLQMNYKIYNFILTMSLTAAVLFAVRDYHGLSLT